MKISTTACDFRKFFGNNHIECIRHLYDAGFRYIDISMSLVDEDNALIIREDWRDTAKRMREFAEDLGMKFVQAHSPVFQKFSNCHRTVNPLASQEEYDMYVKWNIRSIQVCRELGIKNIVVHPGISLRPGKKAFFEENKKLYSELFAAMEENEVNVLTENGTRDVVLEDEEQYNPYNLWTGEAMREFVEYVDHPLFHANWDIAHRNMCIDGEHQYDDLMAMGEHLYGLHLADSRGPGNGHKHFIPYFGKVNFDEIMIALLPVSSRKVPH